MESSAQLKNTGESLPILGKTYLTVSEVAEILRVSPTTIRRFEKEGRIISKRQPNGYRIFNAEDVNNLKESLIQKTESIKNKDEIEYKKSVTMLETKIEKAHIDISANLKKLKTHLTIVSNVLNPQTITIAAVMIVSLLLLGEKYKELLNRSKLEQGEQLSYDTDKSYYNNRKQAISTNNNSSLETKILGVRNRITDFVFNVNVPTFINSDLTVENRATVAELAFSGVARMLNLQSIDDITEETLELAVDIDGDVVGESLKNVQIAADVVGENELMGAIVYSGDWDFDGTWSIQGEEVTATAEQLNTLTGSSTDLEELAGIVTELTSLAESQVASGGIAFGDGSKFIQDTTNLFWNDATNRLGVGTNSPTSTLSVAGGVDVSGVTDLNGDLQIADTNITFDGNSTTFTQTTGDLIFRPAAGYNFDVNLSGMGDFTVNTNDIFVDTDTNRVGILTESPDYTLDVNGTIGLGEYINFNNSTNGETGYGLRYDTGTSKMQFKNAGGSWADIGTGGSGSPGGNFGAVQFNDGGVFGGDADDTFMWNKTGNILSVPNIWAANNSGLTLTDNAGNGIFIEDGGNVGIGTTAPSYTLDVVGDIGIASGSDLHIGNIGLGDSGTSNITSGSYLVGVYPEFANSSATNLQDVLDDLDAAIAGGGSPSSGVLGAIQFSDGSSAFSSDDSNFFWDDTNNRLGIGTSVPSQKLEVLGAIRVSSSSLPSGYYMDVAPVYTGTPADYRYDFSIKDFGGLQNIAAMTILGQTGYVGIGTTVPTQALDVRTAANGIQAVFGDSLANSTSKTSRIGSAHYSNNEEPLALLTGTSGSSSNTVRFGGGSGYMNASTQLSFYTAANTTTLTGTERMTIDSSGNVGIGTSAPGYTLDVVGDIGIALGSDLHIGNIGLGDSGTSNITSGSYLVGVYPELTYSSATNLQDVLDDLDSQIGSVINGTITAVGSVTSGDAFASGTADDQWLGLGAAAGRIEFDNQTIDEINFLDANVGIGTTAPSYTLDVVGDIGIASGSDLHIGNIGLGDSGTSNITSGSYLVGVYPEFANSSATNLQDVLDDLDAAIAGGGSPSSGVLGAIQFSDGSSAFSSDDSNFFWDDTNNRLGIGTSVPAARLEIAGVTSGNAFKVSGGVTNWTNQNVTVDSYGTLKSTGRTDIATNLLFGAIGTSGDTYARFGFGFDTGTPFVGFGPGTAARDIFLRREDGDLAFTFGTSPVEKLRITSDGDVGIGTTAPSAKLEVYGPNNGEIIRMGNVGSDNAGLYARSSSLTHMFSLTRQRTSSAFHDLSISAYGGIGLSGGATTGPASTYQFYLTNGGNVGIGTTAPSYTLDVVGDIGIASGSDLHIGNIGLGDSGTSNITSGSYLVGVYPEFANSSATNLQDVLDDLDAAIAGGGSPSSGVLGAIQFSDGSSAFSSDDSNFFWDDTNNRLGIGTSVPSAALEIENAADSVATLIDQNDDNKAALEIQNAGTGNSIYVDGGEFTVDSTGNISTTGATGLSLSNVNSDLYIQRASGLIGLGDSGSSNTTSGAYLVGVYPEFANSSATNLQDVLDDLDAQLGSVINGYITAVGSMTNGDTFADTSADDQWLGLGAAAGRIEFDNQTIDEINFLDANIGIGTSTPETSLDVQKTVYASSGAAIASRFKQLIYATAANDVLNALYIDPTFDNDSLDGISHYALTVGDGNVRLGVGVSNPTNKLFVEGNVGLAVNSYINWDYTVGSGGYGIRDNGGNLQYRHEGGTWRDIGTSVSPWFEDGTYIYPTNIANTVGIGTTVPDYDLDVAGSIGADTFYLGDVQVTSTAAELNLLDGSTATAGGLVFGNGTYLTQDAANIFWDNTNDRLGIGTTAPSAKLEVVASAGADGLRLYVDANTTSPKIHFRNNSGTDSYIWQSSGGTMLFGLEDVPTGAMAITRSGSVGIGTTVPAYTLDVVGDIGIALGSDLYIGNIGLGDSGTSNTTSGASLVGVYPELTYSSATNLQDVLDDLDSQLGSVVGGYITAVGSMSSGDTFASGTADDQWLGLGAAAGRIEFDNQTIDEINFLDANVGIGTSTPGASLDVTKSMSTADELLAGNLTFTGSSGTAIGFDLNVDYSGTSGTAGVKAMDIMLTGDASVGSGDKYGIYLDTTADYDGSLLYLAANNSKVFEVTSVQAMFEVPVNIGTSGDVSIANNLNFTNLTSSYITSDGPLYIQSGNAGETESLYLSSAGSGDVYVNDGLFATNDGAAAATFNRLSSDGTIISLKQAGTEEGTISVSGATVSYNAFTGSHYAWTDETIIEGMLVSLTGVNRRLHNKPESEIVYGIETTSVENDSRVMGVYLSPLEPTKELNEDNPHLVMAVGNGDLWIVNTGDDIKAGDYLVSSSTLGHAQLDNKDSIVSYIVARAAEDVSWDTVEETIESNGTTVKHKKISVFFESFTRENASSKLAELLSSEDTDFIEQLNNVIEELKQTMNSMGLRQVEDNDGTNNIVIDDNLVVNGDTTLRDVIVTGDFQAGLMKIDSLNNSLNVLGASCYKEETGEYNKDLCSTQSLYLQKNLSGNLDIFDGKVVFTPDGGVIVKGKIETEEILANEYNIKETSNTVGSATIESGDIEISVDSTAIKSNSKIFITPVGNTYKQTPYIKEKREGEGFTVAISDAVNSDIEFDWFIMNVE